MSSAKANGLTLEYDEFGAPNDPVMLLIMGLGAQMILWREEFCNDLAARGFRVVRFDNRDVGRSSWCDAMGVPDLTAAMTAMVTRQPPPPAPYLLSDMAADAAGLLDALGVKRAHIVGASMGGMIAQALAIEHPRKVLSLTSIMSTTGNPDLPQAKPEALGALLGPPPTTREEAIERGISVFHTIGSPKYVDENEIRDLAARQYDRGFNPTGVMRQLVAILSSGSRNEALRRLSVPALVIHGRIDPLVPFAAGEDTAASIPGARLLALDDMGHDMPKPLWPQIIDAICEVAAQAKSN